MAGRIKLEITTPERLLVSADVEEVQVPGQNGYLGILPNHAPLISALQPGEISYLAEGRKERLAVMWGYVEVLPERVTVLAEAAEKAEEIDVPRAEKAKKRAEDLIQKPNAETDVNRATIALQRAIARLQVAGKKL